MSLKMRLANLHLLLRVPSFARWPLTVRFFAEDVWRVWRDEVVPQSSQDPELGRSQGIETVLDFSGAKEAKEDETKRKLPAPKRRRRKDDDAETPGVTATSVVNEGGMQNLDVTYKRYKTRLEKARFVLAEGEAVNCAVCKEPIDTSRPSLALLCSGDECRAVSHLSCLAAQFVNEETTTQSGTLPPVVPTKGTCVSCGFLQSWEDLTTELTLRLRGAKTVEELFKKPRQRKGKAKSVALTDSQVIALDSDVDEEFEEVDIAIVDRRDEEEGEELGSEEEDDDLGLDVEDEDRLVLDEVVDEPLFHEGAYDDAASVSSVTSAESTSKASGARNAQHHRPVFRLPRGINAVIEDSEGEID